jgi:hypothetical protein
MTLREYLNGKGTEEEREEFMQWFNSHRQIWSEKIKRREEKKNRLTKKEIEQIENAVLMFDCRKED